MAWTAADIPDQTGRTAVVTGANGGLGLETARELARKGALVVMAARNLDKAAAAEEDIVGEIPEASLEIRSLDLASLQSIEAFAAEVLSAHPSLALLINNAGVMATPRSETEDGFELQFGTNHLGHFVLTARLMPALVAAAAARVVTVTSTGRHYRRTLHSDDPHFKYDYEPWRAYGRSKMANLQFAVELDRRLRAAGLTVRSLAAHPGYASTDLQAASARASRRGRSQRFFAATVRWVGISPAKGALPQLRAATDPAADGGQLYTPRWVNLGPPVRRPISRQSLRPEDLALLWEVSERETDTLFDLEELRGDDAPG
jgi:NAD(P)-dependent dehydrogenase (short-subunit alcohol dehydrogenase family)